MKEDKIFFFVIIDFLYKEIKKKETKPDVVSLTEMIQFAFLEILYFLIYQLLFLIN